jgi:hypothetical protein
MKKSLMSGDKHFQTALRSSVLALPVVLLAAGSVIINGYASSSDDWTRTFDLDACTFSPNGSNTYFYLEPGYELTLEGEEDGEDIQLVLSVSNETRVVNGVETRTVEERESENGELIEISRNYFAYCSETGDIFYFGEEVDFYEDGEISGHEGAWLAGEDGATAGIIVPARPSVGMKYYQEVAPGVAEDRAEILSLNETLIVPAGIFEDVLKVEETTPLEPGVREYKYHAPGIGLIQDEVLKLTKYVIPETGPGPAPILTPQLQSVDIAGEIVEIPINSTATISGFVVDEQDKSISFTAAGNGQGTEGTTVISIGRILQGPYIVTVNGEVTESVEVTGADLPSESVMKISHEADSVTITVAGTSVVPEFPMSVVAAVASAVGIVGLITRFSSGKMGWRW